MSRTKIEGPEVLLDETLDPEATSFLTHFDQRSLLDEIVKEESSGCLKPRPTPKSMPSSIRMPIALTSTAGG